MLNRLLAALRKRHEQRLAIEALSRLSDANLNDIGLTRFDLERAVRCGVLD